MKMDFTTDAVTWRPSDSAEPSTAKPSIVAITPMVSYRDAYQQFEQPLPLLDQKAFTLVDMTAQWTAPGGRYKLALTGKNLTNEKYRTGGYNFGVATYNNSVIGFYGPPRTVAASIEVAF